MSIYKLWNWSPNHQPKCRLETTKKVNQWYLHFCQMTIQQSLLWTENIVSVIFITVQWYYFASGLSKWHSFCQVRWELCFWVEKSAQHCVMEYPTDLEMNWFFSSEDVRPLFLQPQRCETFTEFGQLFFFIFCLWSILFILRGFLCVCLL